LKFYLTKAGHTSCGRGFWGAAVGLRSHNAVKHLSGLEFLRLKKVNLLCSCGKSCQLKSLYIEGIIYRTGWVFSLGWSVA